MTTFEKQFAAFSKFGDSRSDGKTLTLTQADKWMKQAKIIDKNITTTDTAITFKKFKQKNLNIADFKKYIQELAKTKGVSYDSIMDRMINCGAPGTGTATQATGSGVVDRLTDTTAYTGSHKERFDETGKGKGKKGRADDVDNKGYVQGYKHEDTYDKTHEKPK